MFGQRCSIEPDTLSICRNESARMPGSPMPPTHLTLPGVFDDHVLDTGDLLAVDVKPVVLTGGGM